MFVKKVNEITKNEIDAGTKTYKQVLISPSEAPNFTMRKFIIEPGGSMPMHTNYVEHEQYVLNGKAEVQIGDKLIVVQKDDVVYIPKSVKHYYKTIGDENFEFLCLVPNQDDKLTLI